MIEWTTVDAVIEPTVSGHHASPQRHCKYQVNAVVDRPPIAYSVPEGTLKQALGPVDGHWDSLEKQKSIQPFGLSECPVHGNFALQDTGNLGEEVRRDVQLKLRIK